MLICQKKGGCQKLDGHGGGQGRWSRERGEYVPLDALPVPGQSIGPDCRAGKHPACDGRALDEATDDITDCACTCHALQHQENPE